MDLKEIRVALVVDGEEKTIDEDGYAGKLSLGNRAMLTVHAPLRFIGIHVDQPKDVSLKPDRSDSESERYYETKIFIDRAADGTPCTKYNRGNNMRLLHVGDDDKLALIEVALISQGGLFFVTKAIGHQFCCFNDDGVVRCPYFETPPHRWPQMVELLAESFENSVGDLPSITEYQSDDGLVLNGCGDREGRVLWWSPAQGFGAIKTPAGIARVHWTQIITSSRLARLQQNSTVEFAGLIALASGNGTSFGFEAYGVRSK